MHTPPHPLSDGTSDSGSDAMIGSYAEAWAAAYDHDTHRRRTPQEERDFWLAHACDYDTRCGAAEHTTEALAVVKKLIDQPRTILDVGCGTGRFAIPLALAGHRVVAIDQSPAMLAIARHKASEAGAPVSFEQRSWPADLDRSFDVVLAAWSMYGQRDIALALGSLLAHARDRIILIDSIGLPSCHQDCRQNRAVELAGILAELGHAPNLTAVHETTARPARAVGVVWADLSPRYPITGAPTDAPDPTSKEPPCTVSAAD